jgi:hypothetical protein
MQAEMTNLGSVETAKPVVKSGSWLFLRKVGAVLGMILIGVLFQHAVEDEWEGPTVVYLVTSLLVGAVMLWQARGALLSALCSVHFAVVLVAAIALATAAGTFLPQGETLANLEKRFGEAGALWIERFFLTGLFNSYWFCGMLGVLSLSLALVVLRRKFWRASQWGFFLTHGGMVAVLCGALAGNIYGARGTLDLKVGKSAEFFKSQEELSQPLGFSLKLDAFEIEQYPTEYRLYVLNPAPKGKPALVAKSSGIEDSRKWTAVPKTESRFRVLEYHPDFDQQDTMQAVEDAAAPAAAQIKIVDDKAQSEFWLVEGKSHTGTHGLVLDYAPDGNLEQALLKTTRIAPPIQILTINNVAQEVRLGETYSVPVSGEKFKVLEFQPDFFMDTETKKASSRTNEPRNPALCIQVDGKSPQWVYGALPLHGLKPGQLSATFQYVTASAPLERIWVIDGKTRELVLAGAGKIESRQSLKTGQPLTVNIPIHGEYIARDITVQLNQALAHARPARIARTLSQEARNPAVLLEIEEGGAARQERLMAKGGAGIKLANGSLLSFESRAPAVKSFRSKVSVLEGGEVVRQATVAVNAPFYHKGYMFYQSNYRANEPDYSGFKIVKDPGLSTVYIGLIMISLGVMYIYYIRPRVVNRARAQAIQEAQA